jgi:type IV pilus assembly protein PilB
MSVLMGGLAKRLVSENLINESVAIAAIQMAAKKKQPFVTLLVADNILDGSAIAIAAAQEFGVPLLDLDSYDFTHILANLSIQNL